METINALLHPHHVSLGKKFTSLHMLHQHIEDPFYGLDRQASLKGVAVVRFDVREGPDAFFLEGEVSGLTSLKDVVCEFVGNQTLIVRGSTLPTASFPGEVEPPTALKDAVLPTWRLRERHIGKFERSFTFSSRIKPSGMKTSLNAGLLSIVLPKDAEAEVLEAAKSEIASE